MTKQLEGRTVVITGAGGGQGRAAASLFARAGANLALTDVDGPGLAEAAALAEAEGATVFARAADLRSVEEVERVAADVSERFDTVDVVYNNAGVVLVAGIAEVTEEAWDAVHDVNLKSGFFLVRALLPALRRSHHASVVNVSSGAALLAPAEGNAVYCSSKGGVVSLTRAQARDLAPDGIRVNCILPGPTETPMVMSFFDQFPAEERERRREEVLGRSLLKRFARPEEIASVALFLASDAASYITGAVIPVDAGWTST